MWTRLGLSCVLLVTAVRSADPQIIGQALIIFPGQTERIEYENLAYLRNLPAYDTLKQRFAGVALQQARLAAAGLGIEEEQVDEVVLGSKRNRSYGLFSGRFSGVAAARLAEMKGIPRLMLYDRTLFCPGAGTCIGFLEDSMAAFGSSEQLTTMLQTWQGVLTGLQSNRDLSQMLSSTDPRTPVRGAALGMDLEVVVANAFAGTPASNLDWARVSSLISSFGYSIALDSEVHIAATIECHKPGEAALLHDLLSGLSALERLAGMGSKDRSTVRFQNMRLNGSDRIIEIQMDTRIPSS